MTTLKMYWEYGQRGIMYFNGNELIPFQDVMKNASNGKYDKIIDEWNGPIPVDIWMDITKIKKDLSRFVIQE